MTWLTWYFGFRFLKFVRLPCLHIEGTQCFISVVVDCYSLCIHAWEYNLGVYTSEFYRGSKHGPADDHNQPASKHWGIPRQNRIPDFGWSLIYRFLIGSISWNIAIKFWRRFKRSPSVIWLPTSCINSIPRKCLNRNTAARRPDVSFGWPLDLSFSFWR